MKTALRKQGNSKGITIPSQLLEQLGWNEGTELDLEVQDGKLVAYPLAPSLDAILATIPQGYREPETDWGHDAGLEDFTQGEKASEDVG